MIIIIVMLLIQEVHITKGVIQWDPAHPPTKKRLGQATPIYVINKVIHPNKALVQGFH